MANAGFLYYKKYYQQGATISNINSSIESTGRFDVINCESKHKLELTTTYPGLLSGTGYTHAAKKDDEAYKIGFFFDHTTGMPIIPGSSVKGVLRSLFPNLYKKGKINNFYEEYSQPRKELIKNFLKKLGIIVSNDIIDEFEQEIFEGYYNGKNHTVYNRDLFFDAVPIKIVGNNIGNAKKLFASDYITPHKNTDTPRRPELDPFSNPQPLKFLKVAPLVKYEFRFTLHPSTVISALDVNKKLMLFKNLILFNGVGAKTNVGYGNFTE